MKKKDPSKFILLKKHLDIHHELEEDLLLSNIITGFGRFPERQFPMDGEI
jgi:hypothetical protein